MAITVHSNRDHHVRRSGGDYAHRFLQLFPRGQAWPKEPASTLWKVCYGLAEYWGFVDSRAADLLERDSDPRKTTEAQICYPLSTGEICEPDGLLPDWERAWGLPDPCFPSATTIEARRRMLILYMTYLGGQSRDYYVKLMKFVGYEVHDDYVGEFAPFMAGVSQCGDTRPLKFTYDASGNVVGREIDTHKNFRWYIGPPEQRFSWFVAVGERAYYWFRAGSGQAGVDHHLEIGVPQEIQCLLNRWKPAHTAVVLNFTDVGTNDPMAGTP
jgi:uncharacterized protein YmfQ (DUF2313 family)